MRVRSINTVIAAVVVILVIVTVTSCVWWISSSTYKAVFNEQKKTMLTIVDQSLNALELYLDGTIDMVNLMANDEAVQLALSGGDAADSDVYFKAFMSASNDYWAGFVFDRNGKVVAGYNAQGKDLRGADRSSREYVKKVLSGTDSYVSEQILKPKSGDGGLIFAVVHSVRDASGTVIGGVGLFPKWEHFTRTFIDPFRVGRAGYGFILDNKGHFIAHAVDKSVILKDASGYAFAQISMKEKNGGTRYEWQGREKYMEFKTFPLTGWILAASAYEDDLAAAAIEQRNVMIVAGSVVALFFIGVLIVLVKKLVVSPVSNILEYASEIAKGNLGAELQGRYRYEFSSLAGQIEAMVLELKHKLGFSEGVLNSLTVPCGIVAPDGKMVWANKLVCDLLGTHVTPDTVKGIMAGEFYLGDPSRDTLSQQAIKAGRKIEKEIEYTDFKGNLKNIKVSTTPFYDLDGNMLGSLSIWIDMTEIRQQAARIAEQNERMNHAAEEAEQISQSLSSAAEELSAQIEQSNRGAEEQRDRVAETSTAMEEMNATVLEVASNAGSAAERADTARDKAKNGERIVQQVVDAANGVRSQADELKVSMEQLGMEAKEIGNVLQVINDIADQTNLLALNAAIEAARAGEAGRGFAVVADEVRKLAENTMSATSEVGQAINKIQSMTGKNIAATEEAAQSAYRSSELANESGQTLAEIVSLVENAADQVRSIATAAEQQSATSEEINRATEDISRISMETSQVMSEAANATRDVADMASKLNAVIEDIKTD